jgi:hypothetical protein
LTQTGLTQTDAACVKRQGSVKITLPLSSLSGGSLHPSSFICNLLCVSHSFSGSHDQCRRCLPSDLLRAESTRMPLSIFAIFSGTALFINFPSTQQHYLPFSFPFLFLLRQSSQFSLGEFRPSDVPLNHAAYYGTLKVRSKGGHWSIIALNVLSSPHHHRSLLQFRPPPLAFLPCFLGRSCPEYEIQQALKTGPLQPVTH